jgi:hypothetical protein
MGAGGSIAMENSMGMGMEPHDDAATTAGDANTNQADANRPTSHAGSSGADQPPNVEGERIRSPVVRANCRQFSKKDVDHETHVSPHAAQMDASLRRLFKGGRDRASRPKRALRQRMNLCKRSVTNSVDRG